MPWYRSCCTESRVPPVGAVAGAWQQRLQLLAQLAAPERQVRHAAFKDAERGHRVVERLGPRHQRARHSTPKVPRNGLFQASLKVNATAGSTTSGWKQPAMLRAG